MTQQFDHSFQAIRLELESASTARQRIGDHLEELGAVLADTRAEVRAELIHLEQAVQAETCRLRRELDQQVAAAGRSVVAQLSEIGRRLVARALAGQLVAAVLFVLTVLVTAAGP